MQKVLNLIVLVCLLISFATINSCKKEDIPERIPIVLETARDAPATIITSVGEVLTGSNVAINGNVTEIHGFFVVARGICYNTVPNPSAYETSSYIEQEVQSYDWTGKFNISLTNLTPGKLYYVRAFIAVMTGTGYGDQLILYGNEIMFTTGDPKSVSSSIIYNPDLNPDLTWGSVSDIDGNTYKTVQIGTQQWMAENLRTTKYNNGRNILINYYDSASFKTYGILYDWYTVNTGKLCPAGWHVPDDEEWKQLEMSLGMSRASADTSYADFDVYGMGYRGTDQGTQMKATSGWIPWEGRGGNGTNTSGFSALPAGDLDGGYDRAGVSTSYWCFGDPPIARTLGTDESKVSRAIYSKNIGFSVRCLKD